MESIPTLAGRRDTPTLEETLLRPAPQHCPRAVPYRYTDLQELGKHGNVRTGVRLPYAVLEDTISGQELGGAVAERDGAVRDGAASKAAKKHVAVFSSFFFSFPLSLLNFYCIFFSGLSA